MKVPALVNVPTGAALFWTLILPLFAPAGTVAAIRVRPPLTRTFVISVPFSLAIGVFAEVRLKPTPLIVTRVPARPAAGREPVMERVTV